MVVLDSDTVWRPGALYEMLRPFADPRVGGVTPRQAIFDVGDNPVRRLADWMEDIRYHLTVPAQSVFGQVGCLAGRTIAYRRAAFEPAIERAVHQTVFGVPQHVGDDRVLTNELLRSGWRTVYQATAVVETDAPSDWPTFWRQQLRWGRSSQRETLLSLRWLWRKPVAFACFATDIVTPFALYAVVAFAVAHAVNGDSGPTGLPLAFELPLGYLGMLASIGVRQAAHVRRVPGDLAAAAAVRPADHVPARPDPDRRLRDDVPPGLELARRATRDHVLDAGRVRTMNRSFIRLVPAIAAIAAIIPSALAMSDSPLQGERLLPDLDQEAPSGLLVTHGAQRLAARLRVGGPQRRRRPARHRRPPHQPRRGDDAGRRR